MKAYEVIEGHERVVAHLGSWPSFHDAEVLRLNLARTHPGDLKQRTPVLDLFLYGWVMTPEVAGKCVHKLHGEAIFHFRFEGISDLELEGFNNQNVLTAMNLEIVDPMDRSGRAALRVELEQCYEFQASFVAQKACVVAITPHAGSSQ